MRSRLKGALALPAAMHVSRGSSGAHPEADAVQQARLSRQWLRKTTKAIMLSTSKAHPVLAGLLRDDKQGSIKLENKRRHVLHLRLLDAVEGRRLGLALAALRTHPYTTT